jgi:nucleotide-binding universal stress UspA family protein
MKTIVVATDFSTPAERSMFYAGQLASAIEASVLLLHVYQIPVGMNDMPVLVVSTDELKKNAEAGLERAKKLLQANFGVDVQTEARLGDVIDELENVCEKTNPIAVVIGKHGASGVQRILFGSTSLSIIRHTSYPVIAVPDSWKKEEEAKIAALAIDESVEKLEIQKIRSIVQELKIQLRIIHVKQEKSASLPVKNLVTELNSNYETIYDHEFVHGIDSYVKQNDIDLLIIHPHKHNIVERMFFRTHTKELLKKISIPIMCINEKVKPH